MEHDLSTLLTPNQAEPVQPSYLTPKLRRFANRLNFGKGGRWNEAYAQNEILRSDIAVQNYFDAVRSKRGNDGFLSPNTKARTTSASKDFIAYTGLTFTNCILEHHRTIESKTYQ